MTQYMPGGRRRIDRVLDPSFREGWDELDVAQLRERRADADQEETDLSYDRRLLQGRLDVLKAERESRVQDHGDQVALPRTDEELAAELSRILVDGPRTSRGMGRHMGAEPTRVGEHRREAERAVADVSLSVPASMSDDELDAAINKLSDIERRVSDSRREVQQVVDALSDYLATKIVVTDITDSVMSASNKSGASARSEA